MVARPGRRYAEGPDAGGAHTLWSCQQSVINYSHPIDGKPAVIFANAAANSRSNGTIRIGLINENGTNSEGRINYTFDWKYKKVIRSGEFGYSCLMEQPNGNIVCFYEQESRPDNIHSLVFGEYTLDYIKDIKPTPDTLIWYIPPQKRCCRCLTAPTPQSGRNCPVLPACMRYNFGALYAHKHRQHPLIDWGEQWSDGEPELLFPPLLLQREARI